MRASRCIIPLTTWRLFAAPSHLRARRLQWLIVGAAPCRHAAASRSSTGVRYIKG